MKHMKITSTSIITSIIFFLFISIFISIKLYAEDAIDFSQENAKQHIKSLIKPIGKGCFQIGLVIIDEPNRQIFFPAKVNLRDVLIEYAIVGKTGKLHESLLSTEVSSSHIHCAMLLLGMKNLRPKSAERQLLSGQPIDILLSWKSGGSERKGRIEDWIIIENERQSIAKGMWIYNGARIDDGHFTALFHESIVAIIHDVDALANNPRIGNENDEIWYPNEDIIPPIGTHVTVIFKLLDEYKIPS